jgi:hypothetical protein
MQQLGIPQVTISPYNKHANGVVERGHYIIREALIKSCPRNQYGDAVGWHEKIQLAMFADRVTINSVTGFSPYYLLHGAHPLLPFDLFEATFLVEDFHSGMSTSDLLAARIRQLEKHREDVIRASEVLEKARLQSKEQFIRRYAHRLQKPEYMEGELVLVRNSRFEMELNHFKITPRYLGPYQVHKRTRNGAYVLKELDGTIHQTRYAAFRIISYIQREDPMLSPPPEATNIQHEETPPKEPEVEPPAKDADHTSDVPMDIDSPPEIRRSKRLRHTSFDRD